jgi:hypothetical protein
VYGNRYAGNWAGGLWMVYSKADRRWAEVDLTVVSLELLTVFVGGPLAGWIAYMITRRDWRVSFWMVVLATGEIYGGMSLFYSSLSPLISFLYLLGGCLRLIEQAS